MKRSILLLVISFAALCFSAAPARANLFNFTVNSLDMQYNETIPGPFPSGTFTANVNTGSGGISLATSSDSTSITAPWIPPGNFSITLPLTVISSVPGSESASSTGGTWTLTDTGGDTVTGGAVGTWFMTKDDPATPEVEPSIPSFFGTLSNVKWNDLGPADNDFNGDAGDAVSMSFPFSPQPWTGWMTHLTAPGAKWFGSGSWTGIVTGGTATGVVVPVPAAVLLGMLGLSVAGIKLRKFV